MCILKRCSKDHRMFEDSKNVGVFQKRYEIGQKLTASKSVHDFLEMFTKFQNCSRTPIFLLIWKMFTHFKNVHAKEKCSWITNNVLPISRKQLWVQTMIANSKTMLTGIEKCSQFPNVCGIV